MARIAGMRPAEFVIRRSCGCRITNPAGRGTKKPALRGLFFRCVCGTNNKNKVERNRTKSNQLSYRDYDDGVTHFVHPTMLLTTKMYIIPNVQKNNNIF